MQSDPLGADTSPVPRIPSLVIAPHTGLGRPSADGAGSSARRGSVGNVGVGVVRRRTVRRVRRLHMLLVRVRLLLPRRRSLCGNSLPPTGADYCCGHDSAHYNGCASAKAEPEPCVAALVRSHGSRFLGVAGTIRTLGRLRRGRLGLRSGKIRQRVHVGGPGVPWRLESNTRTNDPVADPVRPLLATDGAACSVQHDPQNLIVRPIRMLGPDQGRRGRGESCCVARAAALTQLGSSRTRVNGVHAWRCEINLRSVLRRIGPSEVPSDGSHADNTRRPGGILDGVFLISAVSRCREDQRPFLQGINHRLRQPLRSGVITERNIDDLGPLIRSKANCRRQVIVEIFISSRTIDFTRTISDADRENFGSGGQAEGTVPAAGVAGSSNESSDPRSMIGIVRMLASRSVRRQVFPFENAPLKIRN